MKDLVIVGAGGFGREVLALVRDINSAEPSWNVLGFVDDAPERAGRIVDGVEVRGGCEWLRERSGESPFLALGVGSPALRMKLARDLRRHARGFPVLIHPTVVRTEYLSVSEGVLITAGNILTSGVRIYEFAMLNLACTVGHDAVVGAYTAVAPGANISGHVTIEAGCEVGTGVKFVQGTSCGEWSIVGAGAVVARDLPANCTAVGVPARVIKEREPGWQER